MNIDMHANAPLNLQELLQNSGNNKYVLAPVTSIQLMQCPIEDLRVRLYLESTEDPCEYYTYFEDSGFCVKEAMVKMSFLQVARAIRYLHRHDICHRDLKLENLLLDRGNDSVYMCDCWFTNYYSPQRCTQMQHAYFP